MPRLQIVRLPNDHTSGTVPGKLHAQRLRRAQRPGAGPDRRGRQPLQILAADRHLRRRGRRPERPRPRGRAPHHRLRHQPLHPARRGGFHHVLHHQHAAHDGTDPRPATHDAIRRGRQAHVQRLPSHARPAAVHGPARQRGPGGAQYPPAWGSKASLKMDFSKEDAADDLLLNEVIWRSVRGPDHPMPAPVRAAYVFAHSKDRDED